MAEYGQNEDSASKKKKRKNNQINDYGQVVLENNKKHGKIHLMTIIGEIEGHDILPSNHQKHKI